MRCSLVSYQEVELKIMLENNETARAEILRQKE